MLSIGFSTWLASSGFQHRALPVQSGIVVYRLADRSGFVAVPIDDWNALGRHFSDESAPIRRKAHLLMGGIIPAVLLIGLFCMAVPGASDLLGAVFGLTILSLLWFGPVAIYLWQSHRIRRIATEIEGQLRRYRRVEAPPQGKDGPPRWLEIALTLLVGPTLLLQIYGSINPHAYDGSPLSGTSLNWVGLGGLAALAIYYGLRWRAKRADAAFMREMEARGRRVDFVGRAHAQEATASRST